MPRRKSQPNIKDFGYKSINFRKDVTEMILDGYAQMSKNPGISYKNPSLSDYMALVFTLGTNPQDKLPELLTVSKGPTKIVFFDKRAWQPVAVEVDRQGRLSSTRVDRLDEYFARARQENPAMFQRQEEINTRKKRGRGRPKKKEAKSGDSL